MRDIKWGKLFDSFLIGIFLSLCIIGFGLLVAVCVKLICLSFESAALVITFVLLVIGITYWAYKYDVI